jgi:magnesium transporter
MLISCAAYVDGKKVADLEVDRISDYLERSNCFVWVALNDPSAAELADMQQGTESRLCMLSSKG